MMHHIPNTNRQLIFRLGNLEDQHAWREFVEIYEPLLHRVAHKLGLNSCDAADAVQEVLVHLSRVVVKWDPNRRRSSFRGWLVRVARNQMLKLIERTTMLATESGGDEVQQLLGQNTIEQSTCFNIEFRLQVFLHVVRDIRDSFGANTWRAFWLTYIDEVAPQEAARSLNTSVGAVYIARSRVMSRLQKEVKRLMEDEWESPVFGDTTSSENASVSCIRTTAMSGKAQGNANE